LKFADLAFTNAGGAKLQHLILYVSVKSQGDDAFGKVKLNKILFLADFEAYKLWGAPITGETYFALENGPAPKHMLPTLNKMVDSKLLAIQPAIYYGYPQEKPTALVEPDIDLFKSKEIALVDSIISKSWGKTAKDMSDESHEFIGWKLAALKEDIPFTVGLVGQATKSKANPENIEKVKAILAATGR
jgi:hypothetical protein